MHFTLADMVTDITQNAVEAGADTVELEVTEKNTPQGAEFRFIVTDNGKGMTEEELRRATDPFVTDGIKHPNRKIGLGLPFFNSNRRAIEWRLGHKIRKRKRYKSNSLV